MLIYMVARDRLLHKHRAWLNAYQDIYFADSKFVQLSGLATVDNRFKHDGQYR
jgi:hypothetical protein